MFTTVRQVCRPAQHSLRHPGCRFTTYRHRFARAAPAPRAKRNDDSKNRGRASPVKHPGNMWFGLDFARICHLLGYSLNHLTPHSKTITQNPNPDSKRCPEDVLKSIITLTEAIPKPQRTIYIIKFVHQVRVRAPIRRALIS